MRKILCDVTKGGTFMYFENKTLEDIVVDQAVLVDIMEKKRFRMPWRMGL